MACLLLAWFVGRLVSKGGYIAVTLAIHMAVDALSFKLSQPARVNLVRTQPLGAYSVAPSQTFKPVDRLQACGFGGTVECFAPCHSVCVGLLLQVCRWHYASSRPRGQGVVFVFRSHRRSY